MAADLTAFREDNRVRPDDRAVHDWYRFVLSFPPHLVNDYLARFGVKPDTRVLDPFCGTGTTLVQCKKVKIACAGIEANPLAYFASRVKVNWNIDPQEFLAFAEDVSKLALAKLRAENITDVPPLRLLPNGHQSDVEKKSLQRLRTLPPEASELLLDKSISPLPLHKTLVLLETLNERSDARFHAHAQLAVAKTLVSEISNLEFGPEVGVGPIKEDVPVIAAWMRNVRKMVEDLAAFKQCADIEAAVFQTDARHVLRVLEPESIDIVITSPPYPNEKDYTRTTRLESVLLGFLKDRRDLRGLKQGLVRSNTRGVYKTDRDDALVADHPEIQRIANAIECRRIELGKTSGFERLYARVTKLYFGGMLRHLSDLRGALRSGAQLAYVVGDQASYLRVMIRTGHLLAGIAKDLGYEVVSIDLFRTRLATATRETLREEVVVLKWPGSKIFKARVLTMSDENRYARIIETIFQERFKEGAKHIDFEREDIAKTAHRLDIKLPKNLGDVVYTFRYRKPLPESIQKLAPEGHGWIIRGTGSSNYRFVLFPNPDILPNPNLAMTKVPDATPGIVAMHALTQEQALLAKVRYNRLVDIFTGVTCYSLQNHLRTQVPEIGQLEADELYVGLDKKGAHYVIPVEGKGGKDKLNVVQVEQDFALCEAKFPSLICRPVAAQFMLDDTIALFEFEQTDAGPKIVSEKHYKLVPPENVSATDLQLYGRRTES